MIAGKSKLNSIDIREVDEKIVNVLLIKFSIFFLCNTLHRINDALSIHNYD